jgi:hypothetical protein
MGRALISRPRLGERTTVLLVEQKELLQDERVKKAYLGKG